MQRASRRCEMLARVKRLTRNIRVLASGSAGVTMPTLSKVTTSVLIYSYKELYPHIITRAAYKIYETYNGSSRHYQAVLIIRSKVRGVAEAALASFNTPLHFEAIINRQTSLIATSGPFMLSNKNLARVDRET